MKQDKSDLEELNPDGIIVAHSLTGEPLTLTQYKVKLDKGRQDIVEGRYLSDEDLRKEMQNW